MDAWANAALLCRGAVQLGQHLSGRHLVGVRCGDGLVVREAERVGVELCVVLHHGPHDTRVAARRSRREREPPPARVV